MGKLEELWKRLEDAKLQMDHCHNYVREIKDDKLSGAIPSADGNYAHVRALRAHQLAIDGYQSALQAFKAALGTNGAADEPAITPREREVLALIASGTSSKQIAAELGIAFRTVVCHRYRIQTKLGAHNTAKLIRAALKMGLIEI